MIVTHLREIMSLFDIIFFGREFTSIDLVIEKMTFFSFLKLRKKYHLLLGSSSPVLRSMWVTSLRPLNGLKVWELEEVKKKPTEGERKRTESFPLVRKKEQRKKWILRDNESCQALSELKGKLYYGIPRSASKVSKSFSSLSPLSPHKYVYITCG